MCGIVGFASNAPTKAKDWLAKGRDELVHRGPDDSGEWWSDDARVGLAHRRLSIIDLSSTARQPMHDISGRYTIVFNGEIYNFLEIRSRLISEGSKFRSNSDTEVIIAAFAKWGVECLNELNGMFSFALHDSISNILFLARDRAGEKPLFYRYNSGELRFGSELKSLLVDPALERRINYEALDCYLSMGYVPGGLCMLEGFNKLPPAHAILFNYIKGDFKIWKYWELPRVAPSKDNASNLLDDFEKLLEHSVSQQMIADVPVGVLLSGGIDSSLITAMAARGINRVKTFTVGFPKYKKIDEAGHARLIANHFGTDHTELILDEVSVDLLPMLAIQFDEPMVDSSMIPTYLVSMLVRDHCKVALGGDGGDELFGGYESYRKLIQFKRIASVAPRSILGGVSMISDNLLPVGFRGKNWMQRISANFDIGVPYMSNFFDESTRKKLLSRFPAWECRAEKIMRQRGVFDTDIIQSATRTDFENYLAEDILVKVDRSSMLSSLEMRSPFLDKRVIEFAFGKIHSDQKVNNVQKKIFLKRLTDKILPKEFNRERKQGFSIPLSEWMFKSEFKNLFNDVLNSEQSIFDKKIVQNLIKNQSRGFKNEERLFALVQFELWRKYYKVTM